MTEAGPQTISVCGSFGFGNAGDEAIPFAISDMAEHFGHRLDVHAISRFNKPAMPEIIGLRAEDAPRLEALRGHPLLLSGGGIIDNKPPAAIYQCAHLMKSSFASRACALGVSVEAGVPYSWYQRRRLWWHLRRFDKIYTRDDLSEETLNGILPGIKTETIGDLVLWLKPDAHGLPRDLILPKRFIAVVLAPRWSSEPDWLSWISSELTTLSTRLDASLVFVPMTGDYDDDRAEHRAVIAEINRAGNTKVDIVSIETPLPPRAIAYVLGKAELAVCMRLHGCVMAYAQRTASVGLVYHPKITGFFDTVGWRHALLPEIAPDMQHDESYGYRFSDLRMKTDQLVQKAMVCRERAEFSKLAELKDRSAAALKAFLEIPVASDEGRSGASGRR